MEENPAMHQFTNLPGNKPLASRTYLPVYPIYAFQGVSQKPAPMTNRPWRNQPCLEKDSNEHQAHKPSKVCSIQGIWFVSTVHAFQGATRFPTGITRASGTTSRLPSFHCATVNLVRGQHHHSDQKRQNVVKQSEYQHRRQHRVTNGTLEQS